ncbi:integrase family protein [Rickettsia tamurae]|uniref:integrase family protein n=1 Tax=Rickettsia tamurae TaxID=334545 RepID=UPI0006908A65|nr:integrase family protein [Rickettsia tamurae]
MTKDSFNFTYSELIKIKIPKEGQVKYKDDKLQCLVLIASYSGSKTFYYGKKINDRYKLKWIGRFPKLSIAKARKKAIEFKEEIASDEKISNLSKKEAEEIAKNKKEVISEWVFPSPKKSKTGHLQEPKKAWKKIIDEAEIENLTGHDLRRSLASWMASENIDTNIIAKTLGHQSINSTLIYARLNVKAVRASMEQALKGKIPIIQ